LCPSKIKAKIFPDKQELKEMLSLYKKCYRNFFRQKASDHNSNPHEKTKSIGKDKYIIIKIE
jgi:hypothetical protein